MYKLKCGTSIAFGENFASDLTEAKSCGFESVDFDLTRFWRDPEKEIELYRDIEKGLSLIEKSGLILNGVHLSFGTEWDFSDVDENKRQDAVERAARIMRRIDGKILPACYVLHGSFEPIADSDRAEKIKRLIVSLDELKKSTAAFICLENLPRSCLGNTSEELLGIINAVGGIKACVDVNHFSSEKPEDAILKIGDKIFTTHISDYDFIDEKHWLPYEGSIDWKKLVAALEKVGYKGIFNFECGSYTFAERYAAYVRIFREYD